MAERIMMTPAELDDAAKFVENCNGEISQIVQNLSNRLEDIASRWEGLAKESFINQFTSILKPILDKNVPSVLLGIKQELNGAAEGIRRADEEIANAINQAGQAG